MTPENERTIGDDVLEAAEKAKAKDDGGPAFPYTCCVGHNHVDNTTGMTIRDYFAGQALNALISGGAVKENGEKTNPQYYSMWAYELADVMILERKK